MLSKYLPLSSLVAAVAAQSLTDVIANTSGLSALGSLLSAQPDLVGQLGNASNITLLAPSNDAITVFTNSSTAQAAGSDSGLVSAILQYHVLQGAYQAGQIPDDLAFVPTLLSNSRYANVTGGQVVGVERDDNNVTIFSGLLENSTVSQANVNFTGGVIHVIDKFLTVPAPASDTLTAAGLSALAGALTLANLVDTVNSLQNVTIFAPNNIAFQNISSALADLPAENLTRVLQYHVVVGERPLYSSRLTASNVTTLAGENVTITLTDDDSDVFVNGARVILPNVLVAGGVVHVIDNVLNPDNTTAIGSDDSPSEGSGAFGNATAGTDTPFTSGQPVPTTTVGGSTPTGSAGSQASSTSSGGAAMPMMTGAVDVAAMFGVGAALFVM